MKQIALIAAALLLAGGAQAAQGPERVRGTIAAMESNVLTVKSAGGNTTIHLAEKTVIVFTQPIALSDLKPGDFLGVTSMKREDGTLTAYEVRRFPKPVNPGHRPFDGKSDQTMTNATVGATVQSASGRELTMTYDGGSQKIVVPENASVSALVPGNRSQLVPGAAVNLTANPGEGGKLTAIRIQVSPPK
jgi:uncharacterized protein DUF5666